LQDFPYKKASPRVLSPSASQLLHLNLVDQRLEEKRKKGKKRSKKEKEEKVLQNWRVHLHLVCLAACSFACSDDVM